MSESPSVNKDRVLTCSVYCNGNKLGNEYTLVAATVHLELNRIGKATLKFNAGNTNKQTFDESDADLFKPGNAIRLEVGDIEKENIMTIASQLRTIPKSVEPAENPLLKVLRGE